MDSKDALRRSAVRQRAASARADLDAALAPLVTQATRVAAYWPVGTEPRVTVQPGWLLPVVTATYDLDWSVFDGSVAAVRGLQEPTGPRLGVEALASCDLVLVPALLVDARGHRLGKGAGCYDRALRRPTGLTVALLHDHELVEELPSEDHDVPVMGVATPASGFLRLPRKM